jgi:hypothetical protein
MGMGLTFEKLDPEQSSVLADWFMSRTAQSAPQPEDFPTGKSSESVEEQDSPDRALLLKLIKMLDAGGRQMPL